jgi:hypothetical protein
MARTGESFAAANRNMENRPGPFERYVRSIIPLAEAWHQYERTQPRSGDIRNDLDEIFGGDRHPTEVALEAAVRKGSREFISKLETLMYAGRDRDEFRALHKHLTALRDGPDLSVDNICEKLPLAEYLRRGLEEAVAQRVDLEQAF